MIKFSSLRVGDTIRNKDEHSAYKERWYEVAAIGPSVITLKIGGIDHAVYKTLSSADFGPGWEPYSRLDDKLAIVSSYLREIGVLENDLELRRDLAKNLIHFGIDVDKISWDYFATQQNNHLITDG